MEQVGHWDFRADRYVPFVRAHAFLGYDFTGATFHAQVRRDWNWSGAPLIDMPTVAGTTTTGVKLLYAGTATIAAHIAAGRLSGVPDAINPATGLRYASTDNVLLSHVRYYIAEATVTALPFDGTNRAKDMPLVWDLHITPSGGIKDRWLEGAFVVDGGSTQ